LFPILFPSPFYRRSCFFGRGWIPLCETLLQTDPAIVSPFLYLFFSPPFGSSPPPLFLPTFECYFFHFSLYRCAWAPAFFWWPILFMPCWVVCPPCIVWRIVGFSLFFFFFGHFALISSGAFFLFNWDCQWLYSQRA